MKIGVLIICLFLHQYAFSESEEPDYQGITDPFTDPTRYEFAEDEREDKEFFHLGRYFMLSADGGIGVFSQALGLTTTPAAYFGLRLIYFFDRKIALDVSGGYANHLETVQNNNQFVELETIMIPATVGLRYYFDTKSSPKSIAMANPYLNFGAGGYTRIQNVLQVQGGVQAQNGNTTSFGAYAGAGVQFNIYRRHIYFGLDVKYHLIFFVDENSGYLFSPGDREGDYSTIGATITYNF